MSKPFMLVCPASRGIGFALARHLLQHTNVPMLATARTDPDAVKQRLLPPGSSCSDRLTVLEVDVTDEASVRAAAERAGVLFPAETHHLRVGVALPGVLGTPEKTAAQIDLAHTLETFAVNAVGPMLLMKHFSRFLPRKSTNMATDEHLPAHAVWANMSARVGSITDNGTGGWYAYRASKAAVNAATKTFDHELRVRCGQNAMAVAYHPGTVRTELSRQFWKSVRQGTLLEPEVAAEHMARVLLERLGLDDRGRCWDWRGDEIPP